MFTKFKVEWYGIVAELTGQIKSFQYIFQLTPEEIAKQDHRKELNRKAASKCRNRRKLEMEQKQMVCRRTKSMP